MDARAALTAMGRDMETLRARLAKLDDPGAFDFSCTFAVTKVDPRMALGYE